LIVFFVPTMASGSLTLMKKRKHDASNYSTNEKINPQSLPLSNERDDVLRAEVTTDSVESAPPVAPPHSAYLFFSKIAREKLSKRNPNLNFTEITKETARLWHVEETKAKYERKFAEAMIEYWWKIAHWKESYDRNLNRGKDNYEDVVERSEVTSGDDNDDDNNASDNEDAENNDGKQKNGPQSKQIKDINKKTLLSKGEYEKKKLPPQKQQKQQERQPIQTPVEQQQQQRQRQELHHQLYPPPQQQQQRQPHLQPHLSSKKQQQQQQLSSQFQKENEQRPKHQQQLQDNISIRQGPPKVNIGPAPSGSLSKLSNGTVQSSPHRPLQHQQQQPQQIAQQTSSSHRIGLAEETAVPLNLEKKRKHKRNLSMATEEVYSK